MKQIVLLMDQKISLETLKFHNENNIIVNSVVGITVTVARPVLKEMNQFRKNCLNCF